MHMDYVWIPKKVKKVKKVKECCRRRVMEESRDTMTLSCITTSSESAFLYHHGKDGAQIKLVHLLIERFNYRH